MLLLAVILNPRAKRRARLAGRTEIPRGCGGDSGGSVVKTVIPAVQQDNEKNTVSPRMP